jgi:vitamin B12 transporter
LVHSLIAAGDYVEIFNLSLSPGSTHIAWRGEPGGRNIMSYRVLFACLLSGVFLCTPTFAQPVGDQADEIDNIIVTASRSPLAKVNVGSSTTVITREQIELRQSRFVTDLLRSVPGFAVSQVGTTGSQIQVRVRGAEANHVLVLIDGVRANDPASGDEFRWELLSAYDVERIEIVRGPQSSLWGSDAVSGVVHVITQSGSARPALNAYAEVGSNSTVNGGLNGGIGGDRWSLGFGLERLDTGGTNISRSGTEDDESDMTTASLSSQIKPTENLDIRLGLRAVDAYSQFDPVDFFVTGLPEDGDVATESERLYLNAGATLRTLDGRVLHHLDARYLDSDNTNLTDGVANSSTASDRKTLTYQSDIQLKENLLSLAIEHETTRFAQRGEIGFGDPNQDQEMSVNSFIADFQGKSMDRLTLLVGARYDDYSDFDSAVSGRLSVAYSVSDTTVVRANVGTGRKVPTFIERFGFFPEQFIGNPDLKPEESISYDIGIDQVLFDGALDLQLGLFYQDLQNEINGFVFDPDTFLFTAENSAGDSTRKGVEASAIYSLTDNLSFGGSYTYTDSTESNEPGSDVRELRRPRHNGNLNTSYRFLDERAHLTIVADYGGSSTDIFFPPFPAPPEIVSLDSFWLLDLTASYDINQNTNVFVRGNNLLDEHYEQVFGYRTPGRSAYAGIRLSFGK